MKVLEAAIEILRDHYGEYPSEHTLNTINELESIIKFKSPNLNATTLTEEERDNMTVDAFAMAMKAKLEKARLKGYKKWHDKNACSDERLTELFYGHLNKTNDGNFIDLANFCMFLHARGAPSTILQLRYDSTKPGVDRTAKCNGCEDQKNKIRFTGGLTSVSYCQVCTRGTLDLWSPRDEEDTLT